MEYLLAAVIGLPSLAAVLFFTTYPGRDYLIAQRRLRSLRKHLGQFSAGGTGEWDEAQARFIYRLRGGVLLEVTRYGVNVHAGKSIDAPLLEAVHAACARSVSKCAAASR